MLWPGRQGHHGNANAEVPYLFVSPFFLGKETTGHRCCFATYTPESDEAMNTWRGPGIWVLLGRQENE